VNAAVTDALDALHAAWRAERVAARARFAEERRATSLARRVRRGLALDGLEVAEVMAAPRDRVKVAFVVPDGVDLDALSFGPGDPVRVGAGERGPWVRGVLQRIGGGRVWIVADVDLPDEIAYGRALVEAEAPEVTFDRGDAAIAKARAARGVTAESLEILFGARAARAVKRPPAWEPLDAALDDAQRAAVGAALAAEDVALVHGPPGTGKTRTLVEIVRQLCARDLRVLAAAASNTAVDNLGERLAAAGLDVVRLGHPARVSAALEDETLDARVDADGAAELARDWRDRARDLRRRGWARRDRAMLDEARALERDARRELASAEQAIIGRAQVVLATCTGADHPVLADVRFDAVVLDEATQAVDPLALAALLRAPRAILAGDPHQLPPTVIDPGAARAGLATTFFERLARDVPPSMLVRQHRMHEEIMRFPSEHTYGGRLVAAPAVATHVLEDLGAAPDPLRPKAIWLVDTAGKDWGERKGGVDPSEADDDEEAVDPSTWNPGHAERTAAEVRRLLSRGVAPGAISVIAPYDAQARRLRALLAAERAAGVEIATIDSFQGRENEAVVLDLVRSNERGELGFLGDLRRTNVALTRARRALVIVADSATIGAHPYYAALLASLDARDAHGSAWSDDAPPVA
jgi:superfamily I DNA and/or RNA helicase